MAGVIKLRRNQAARFINEIREVVSEVGPNGTVQANFIIARLKSMLGDELALLVECPGEAHDPAVGGMIDNCVACMPRWGLVGPFIKIT